MMYQDVNISGSATDIDAGKVSFHLSGWLANYDQPPHDRATLAIGALDSSNNQLMYISQDHRSPTWTNYSIENKIPYGTRTLRVFLKATRFVGSDNDAYFDDLSLEIKNADPKGASLASILMLLGEP